VPVLAKSDPAVPLRDHLTDVRDCASRLLTPARRAAFGRLGVGENRAEELLLGAAWLHDWGKATQQWQDAILAIQRGEKSKPPQHALSSFLACRWALGKKIETIDAEYLAMMLAVLAHHGQLHKGSLDPKADKFNRAQVSPLLEVWEELARGLAFPVAPSAKLPTPFAARMICDFVGHAKTRVHDLARIQPFRGLYCLLLSLLVEADHTASGNRDIHDVSLSTPRLPGTITPFQNAVKTHPAEMLCAIAGCGSGKTAAALLRAAEYSASHDIDRIVLCLPTRFTSNSLLRDMNDPQKYNYPHGVAGLMHSEALQVLREHFKSDEEETDFPDSPEEVHTRSIRYENPITISTVDHLLMSLYHGYKYSDRAFGNLMSSLVVFDEIHAYDTTTLNAIRDGQEVLRRHGVPCLFMSATLPATRRRFFNLSESTTLRENDNPFVPFRIHQLEEPLTIGRGMMQESTLSARRFLKEARGVKLAVYVNQVERAKALCRTALEEFGPEYSIFCYHSELAPRDRLDLENKIIEAFKEDAPVIAIATQAAELSLDISAERMITELTPADVLVQRSGRLHRRGKSPQKIEGESSRLPDGFEYQLLVAPLDIDYETAEDKHAGLPYKDAKLLQRTWQLAPWDEDFSFARGLDWCEKVLTDEVIHRPSRLFEQSNLDAVFGNRPQENYRDDGGGQAVTIRDIEPSYLVIPRQFYDAELPKDRALLSQLMVPLSRTKFHTLCQKGVVLETETCIEVRRNCHQTDTVDFPIRVVQSEVSYDPRSGGFDFRPFFEESDNKPSAFMEL
jgi:CRISPR-associated helicase Cas3/CRISPR-associated endonuclease Cas3-HD